MGAHKSSACTALAALLSPACLARADYIFTPIDLPGQKFAQADAINAQGDIVGISGQQAFLLHQSAFQFIQVAGRLTHPWGINDPGQIVGEYFPASGGIHGFLLTGSGYTDLLFPGAAITQALGINNSGAVVGSYSVGGSTATGYGFALLDGSYTSLDPPGSVYSYAWDINSGGKIVGSYQDAAGTYHGFTLENGVYTTIDEPGSPGIQFHGINDAGAIVGNDVDSAGVSHGFLLDGGRFTRLDPPGATFTNVFGINDAGQAVGLFIDSASKFHGFLATPVPEPTTVFVGLAILTLLRSHRNSDPLMSHGVASSGMVATVAQTLSPTAVRLAVRRELPGGSGCRGAGGR